MEFEQINILLGLFASHLLADFVLQNNKMASGKKKGLKSKYFVLHLLIVAFSTYLALGFLAGWDQWEGAFIITTIHGCIDWVKTRFRENNLWLFIADQFLHLITLIIYWLIFTGQSEFDFISNIIQPLRVEYNLLILTGYLVVTLPVGIIIGFMTKEWRDEIEKKERLKNGQEQRLIDNNIATEKGLENAGKWIGMLERFLVLTFIILNEFRAIGFLLAAKSVFRFGDLKDGNDRRRTEYILIGTLLSFSFSVVIGLLIKYLLQVI